MSFELTFGVIVYVKFPDICVMLHDLDLKLKVTATPKVRFTVFVIYPKLLVVWV